MGCLKAEKSWCLCADPSMCALILRLRDEIHPWNPLMGSSSLLIKQPSQTEFGFFLILSFHKSSYFFEKKFIENRLFSHKIHSYQFPLPPLLTSPPTFPVPLIHSSLPFHPEMSRPPIDDNQTGQNQMQ